MAFRKSLAQRLFNITKISSQTPNPTTPNAFVRKFLTPHPGEETGFFRRWLQERAIFQSAVQPGCLKLPVGDKLIERLRGLNGDRLQLDGLSLPPPARSPRSDFDSLELRNRISVDDARKLLRLSQLEVVKSALRAIPDSCVSYPQFVQIVESCTDSKNPDEVPELVKALDESGVVIVLRNVVFLRPDQVVRAIENVIPLSVAQPNDPRRKELEMLEEVKMEIDRKAETLVRRELWCGLGLLVVQTAGFMRLTFWELSWDVMEPICYYVTSIYCIAGYAFFLRTSRDPSFEGFFESRFCAKQKRLMKANKFDIDRFKELRAAFHLSDSPSSSLSSANNGPSRTLLGAMHQ